MKKEETMKWDQGRAAYDLMARTPRSGGGKGYLTKLPFKN